MPAQFLGEARVHTTLLEVAADNNTQVNSGGIHVLQPERTAPFNFHALVAIPVYPSRLHVY